MSDNDHKVPLPNLDGDVQMVDLFLADDLRGVRQRSEKRQAPVPDMVAPRTIVDKPHDLIAELTVLKNPLGDHASEIAGAGDQDSLEPDAGLPSPLQELAHELA